MIEDIYAHELERRSWIKSLTPFDWLWSALVAIGVAYAYGRFASRMDGYETAILGLTGASLVLLGWAWKPNRAFSLAVAALSLFAVYRYGSDPAAAERDLVLRYLLSSQAAILWMSAFYILATAAYFTWLFTRRDWVGGTGAGMTWAATVMGFTGLLVRWHESHLLGLHIGPMPVGSLCEVFILFVIVTALLYLYYEGRYANRSWGGPVLLAISAALAYLLWYSVDHRLHEVHPLVPILSNVVG